MKILITGAGEIGYDLSQILSEEQHDVTVLDMDPEAIQRVSETLDVLTVEGNATSPNMLIAAGAREADLMIAVTSIDEVNIIASVMAKRLGVRKVIARVRNDELSRQGSPIHPSELGIDVLIHPEESAANEIYHLILRAAASDVVSLAEDRIQLIGVRIDPGLPVVGRSLEEITRTIPEIPYRIVAIGRRGSTIIPRGQNRLQAFDHIFVLSRTEDIHAIISALGVQEQPVRNIMIAGGSQLGRMLAVKLSEDPHAWNIKLIEPDESQAIQLANDLINVLVLHGNSTDPDLLATEGIREMDAFVSVTEDEESNIISCLMARHLEVRKTVALVSKPQYVPLSQTIGIDSIVNVKAAAADEIHRQIRQGQILTVKALRGVKAEVIEVEAKENFQLLDRPLHTASIPDGIVIGGILRNGSIEIATGQSVIRENDRVIFFALPRAIPKISDFFR